MQQKFLKAISRFAGMRVLVVGDIMLDVYEFLLTRESKPIDSEKPGKRAYKAQKSVKTLGGAGNVAMNLAALGARTHLIGVTGNDEHYFKLRELAEQAGIRHVLIRDSTRPTTTKGRLYLDGEYLLRRDDEAAHDIDRETSITLVNEVVRALAEVDAVILSDYAKGVFTEPNARQIIHEARLHSLPVVVDFKPVHQSYFTGADLIAPNATEAAQLLGGFSLARRTTDTRRLHRLLGCSNTVVTLGRHGVCGFDGATYFHVPANRVRVIDAVGCGDTVRAVLTLGRIAGLSLGEAAALANDAAAVIVQKAATATLSAAELAAFVRRKGRRANRAPVARRRAPTAN